MPTLQEFFDFETGIFCDYDGAYGDQCFDLANAYSRWIGGERFTGGTADLIFNQPGDFYIQIPNTPDGVPKKGDIVIWSWPHVGISTGNGNTNSFEVLEQNDPTDSNCHIKMYPNYNGVIGWLHPKQLPQDTQSIIDQLRIDRDNNWNLYQATLKQLTECQNSKVVSPTDIPVTTNNGSTVVSVSTEGTSSATQPETTTKTTTTTQTTSSNQPFFFSNLLSYLIAWVKKPL